VIIATTHTTKKGAPKLVRECTLPLTGKGVVSMVVTEWAVMKVAEGIMELTELAPGVTVEDIRTITEADFAVCDTLEIMKGTEEE
jgi:3-oxoacid CoA-transferase subunit B/acetate CoA/acetoacetate CoA-transferase beta subunit